MFGCKMNVKNICIHIFWNNFLCYWSSLLVFGLLFLLIPWKHFLNTMCTTKIWLTLMGNWKRKPPQVGKPTYAHVRLIFHMNFKWKEPPRAFFHFKNISCDMKFTWWLSAFDFFRRQNIFTWNLSEKFQMNFNWIFSHGKNS